MFALRTIRIFNATGADIEFIGSFFTDGLEGPHEHRIECTNKGSKPTAVIIPSLDKWELDVSGLGLHVKSFSAQKLRPNPNAAPEPLPFDDYLPAKQASDSHTFVVIGIGLLETGWEWVWLEE